MRTSTAVIAVLSCTILVSGCASAPPAPPPVAVTGAPEALGVLAGEWRGEYWSADTGRRGIIRFSLEADSGAAWGDVWMLPAVHPQAGPAEHHGHGDGAVPLQVRFVRVGAGGALSGTIEPYRDPDCDCMLSTTFTGELDRDRIEGAYTSRGGPAHAGASGKWEVRRVAGGAP